MKGASLGEKVLDLQKDQICDTIVEARQDAVKKLSEAEAKNVKPLERKQACADHTVYATHSFLLAGAWLRDDKVRSLEDYDLCGLYYRAVKYSEVKMAMLAKAPYPSQDAFKAGISETVVQKCNPAFKEGGILAQTEWDPLDDLLIKTLYPAPQR